MLLIISLGRREQVRRGHALHFLQKKRGVVPRDPGYHVRVVVVEVVTVKKGKHQQITGCSNLSQNNTLATTTPATTTRMPNMLYYCMYIHKHKHLYIYIYICMHVCMYACMHVCMYVRPHAALRPSPARAPPRSREIGPRKMSASLSARR